MTWGPCMMYYHCPECGKKIEDEEIAKKLIELDKEMANLGEDISDEDR